MRKLIIIAGFFGCFFCFYGLGAYLKTYPLSPGGSLFPFHPLVKQSAPVTVPPNRPPLPAQQASNVVVPKKPLAKAIEEDKGAQLLESLGAARLEPFSRLQSSFNNRFSQEYPKTEIELNKEAANRVGMLQAMNQYSQQALTSSELQALTQFYDAKIDDPEEHPSVRQGSYCNRLRLTGRNDEADRLKVLARAGRSPASACGNPEELLEEIFRVEAP